MEVILYGTSACHLCEAARDLLWSHLTDGASLRQIDVADSDELLEHYGTRIPVVVLAGRELNWPFTSDDLRLFLTPKPAL